MNQRTRGRLIFLLLAVLFFAPLIGAYLVYFGPDDWTPSGRTAHGQLVDPAKPLPEELRFRVAGSDEPVDLAQQWTLLHVEDGVCGEPCGERLWQTRQMHTLLHRRRDRVRRAVLVEDSAQAQAKRAATAEEHPQLLWLSLQPDQRRQFDQWLGELPVANPVLIIDPLGNFMLYYGDELPLKGMLSDIKRMLKLSNIG